MTGVLIIILIKIIIREKWIKQSVKDSSLYKHRIFTLISAAASSSAVPPISPIKTIPEEQKHTVKNISQVMDLIDKR